LKLQLGHVCQTDWFPDPLVLQVSTTTRDAPQQTATVTTHTERVTERVWQRGLKAETTTAVGAFVRSIGTGALAGELTVPMGVAGAQEPVFVTDYQRDCVEVFDLEGQSLRRWGTEGEAAGEFDGPWGIAVASDEVYIADSNNHRVQVFDLEGHFLWQWGTEGAGPGEFNDPRGIGVSEDRV
jgi:DNA-binding beta-propeller fold protein YncE